MSSAKSRSGIGGVYSVVLWQANDSGRITPPTSLDSDVVAVRIPIDSTSSSYNEVVTINRGVVKVNHTLTLVTDAECDFWSHEALSDASRVGCIAEVTLSSYGKILVGWSSNLLYEQPLMLTRTSVVSSDFGGAELPEELGV